MKKIIIIPIVIVIAVLSIIIAIVFSNKIPEEALIEKEITIDYQPGNIECSGYAASNALRLLGIDASGQTIYNGISNKNYNGTVSPMSLSAYLEQKGYENRLAHSCSMKGLKKMISEGNPIIIYARVSPNSEYDHFFTVIGYDKKNIYAIDSLSGMKNVDNKYYNRVIKMDDFVNMWNTNSEYDNVYIKISK